MGKKKIIWLTEYRPHWDFNHWFHLGFANVLSTHYQVELKTYGPKVHLSYPHLCLRPYNESLSLHKLRALFDFDVIIIDGKSRAKALPVQLSQFNNAPKIVIEGDFHNYLNETNWYLNRGITTILHRHSNNVKLGNSLLPAIEHLWFPCSANTEIFKPNPNISQSNLIAFVGGLNECYPLRIKGVKLLKEAGLIRTYSKRFFRTYSKRLYGNDYVHCLQSYPGHLNSSSAKFNIETAKMFEIMACGAVLLTNDSDKYAHKSLFYEDSYCLYKEDLSDLKEQVRKILLDNDYRSYVSFRAVNCINERHSHNIRVEELIKIINTL